MRRLVVVLIAALVAAAPGLAADPAVKAAAAAQRALVKVIRTYDLDRNRTLDANELQELNRVYAGAPEGPLVVLDADRNGQIDPQEVAVIELGAPPSAGLRSYDGDRNGKIEGPEVDALRQAFDGATKGPVRAMDRNRDGKLDDAEIAALNERLARPQARKAKTASANLAATPVPEAPPEKEGTGTARLSWQPPTQNADGTPLKNLAGYVIRYGRNPKALNRRIQLDDPKLTTYTVEKLGEGTWHFSVAAVTQGGAESVAGPVVSKTVAASDKAP